MSSASELWTLRLEKNNATGATPWIDSRGCAPVLQVRVISVGATPTASIVIEHTNMLDGPTTVTPLQFTPLVVTGVGFSDTSTSRTYKYVRLNCTANTNVNFVAVAIGVEQ